LNLIKTLLDKHIKVLNYIDKNLLKMGRVCEIENITPVIRNQTTLGLVGLIQVLPKQLKKKHFRLGWIAPIVYGFPPSFEEFYDSASKFMAQILKNCV